MTHATQQAEQSPSILLNPPLPVTSARPSYGLPDPPAYGLTWALPYPLPFAAVSQVGLLYVTPSLFMLVRCTVIIVTAILKVRGCRNQCCGHKHVHNTHIKRTKRTRR